MSRSSMLSVFTGLMLAGTLVASLVAENRKPHPPARALDQIPMNLDGWAGTSGRVPDARELELLGATTFLSRDYRRAGRDLNLFVAYYAVQKAGESMHTPKNCLPAAGWEILKYDEAEMPFEGRPGRINKFTIQNGDARAAVLYWYQNKDRIIASEYEGKAFMLWDAITQGRTDGAAIRIMSADNPESVNDAVGFARKIVSQMTFSFGS